MVAPLEKFKIRRYVSHEIKPEVVGFEPNMLIQNKSNYICNWSHITFNCWRCIIISKYWYWYYFIYYSHIYIQYHNI